MQPGFNPIIAFVDLDDTLFQTKDKCPGTVSPDELVAASNASTGKPHSFTTAKQRSLLRWLQSGAVIVPTTARDVAGLRRCTLPFAAQGPAICGFGGTILGRDGIEDKAWTSHMNTVLHPAEGILGELKGKAMALGEGNGISLRATLLQENGLHLYLSVKPENASPGSMVRFAEVGRSLAALLPDGWRLHLNTVSMAVLPPGLSKQNAVRYFLEHHAEPDAVTLGFGDSLSDGGFMALCDWAAVPNATQIGRAFAGMIERFDESGFHEPS